MGASVRLDTIKWPKVIAEIRGEAPYILGKGLSIDGQAFAKYALYPLEPAHDGL